jgi:hypothetical protein
MLGTLGDKVADRKSVSPESPVSAYWEKGYQAVIIYCANSVIKDYKGMVWHKRDIKSPWPNSNETIQLHGKLKENLETGPKNKFFVLQGILTPDTELIKKEVFESGGISIKSIAQNCNCKVVDWVEEEWKQETLNVVIIDFFDNCSLLPSVINYNRK